MKKYSSFAEIDRDLKIMELQTQIDKEQIKLSLEHTKQSLSPMAIMGNIGSVALEAVLLKGLSRIIGSKHE